MLTKFKHSHVCRESIRSQRFYHKVWSGASAGGAGIAGFVGALKLAPTVGVLLPTIVAAPVAIVGIPLGLGVWYDKLG